MMRPISVLPILTALCCGCSSGQTPVTEPAALTWEHVEYLSDHLAVAMDRGTAWLITAEGDIVATSDDPAALKAGADAAYARFLDEEFNAWEMILDQYDSLCNACIARQPSEALLVRLDRLRDHVRQAVGQMDPQQRERFSDIRSRYEKYRR